MQLISCCKLLIFKIKDFEYGSEIRSPDFNLGPLHKLKSRLPYPHRHDCYQIVWVEDGTGHHTIDSVRHQVKAKTLFFMSPGQIHDFVLSDDAIGSTINFSQDFFALQLQNKNSLKEIPIYNLGNSIPVIYLDDEQARSMMETLRAIDGEYYSDSPGWQDMIRSYLYILLMKASRMNLVDLTSSVSRSLLLTRRFKDILENQFNLIQDVSIYAQILRVNERALNEAVQRSTGLTASKMIRERIMLEAKRLLLHSDIAISEVADQLAFDDPAYFSRCFKKHTGRSPIEFRQSLVRLLA
jgi:AraC family transcriptional activator of pobA